VPVAGLGPLAGPAMKVADVLLAIAYKHPGLGPTAMQQHPLWLHAQAGGRPPKALSSITRPAQQLESAGKLSRDGGYQVTAKYAAEAERLYALLVGAAGSEQAGKNATQVEAEVSA
jgi:hypothetical protein